MIHRPRRYVLFSLAIAGALSISTVALAVEPTTATARNVWEWRDGQLTLATPQQPTTTQPTTTDATLDRVDALLAAGEHKAARKLAIGWEKTNRSSPLRDRVLLQIANAFYDYGDRTKAFFYCDELMDTYPQSGLFYAALDLQYRVADAYLNGYKQRVFRIPLVTVPDDGVEMMYRVQSRSPGSPLAERALLRTADFYFASADFDLAGDAYAWYVKSYPRSPKVPRVRLRAAYSSLAQFRGLRYDSTPLADAKAQFQALVNDYPRLAAEENLPDLIARIDTTFARKALVSGDFYRRTRQPVGAAYSYYDVVQAFPNTPEAAEATKALDALPPSAKDTAVAVRGSAAQR